MKIIRLISVIVVTVFIASVLAGERPSGVPELTSLRGTMITVMGEDTEGVPVSVWAKGRWMRTELVYGSRTIVTIQQDDTLYTFEDGDATGTKQRFRSGLASLPLIKQIAEVKAHGRWTSSKEIAGVEHHEYTYLQNAERGVAIAFISAQTSLPRVWISLVRMEDDTASKMTIHYRDMEANVALPDALLALPAGVTFSD